jgi:BirA family biotin operon repressor/biotin-[acetyl-CoA-carboxylase] ligase
MYIAETNSTNTLLLEQYSDSPNLFTIRTDFQTAGRGQQGNGWESERGANLLFSTLLRTPDVPASGQFFISMAVSVALCDAISRVAGELQERLCIKWPNDIYAGDKKLAGILIENTLEGGHIAFSIAGAGLNVNQKIWHGSAPNPTSLLLQTGKRHEPQALLDAFLESLPARLADKEGTRSTYMELLYRRKGLWPYAEREVSTAPTMNSSDMSGAFMAEIADVTQQGELVLRMEDGEQKRFHFKQIRFVIKA